MNWNSVDLGPALDKLFAIAWEIRSCDIQQTFIFTADLTNSLPQGGQCHCLKKFL